MNFDEIISTVSIQDALDYKGDAPLRDSVALFARLIVNGHPGWDNFPKEHIAAFKTKIESLYNNPPQGATEDETTNLVERALATITRRHIPDNHLQLISSTGRPILSREDVKSLRGKCAAEMLPETHVGDNTVTTLAKDERYTPLFLYGRNKNSETGDIIPEVGIFETTRNGQKIGVIAMAATPFFRNTADTRTTFLEAVQKITQSTQALIWDVRDNSGGDPELMLAIAAQLNGAPVTFESAKKLRLTPEAKLFHTNRVEHWDEKTNTSTYEDHWCLPKEQLDTLYRDNAATEYVTLPNVQNQFDPDKTSVPYGHPVYILTNRQTASAGEYVCALAERPDTQFVGENTMGSVEYLHHPLVTLPTGAVLKMASFHILREGKQYIAEGIGHAPTKRTAEGKDAFDHALRLIDIRNPIRERMLSQGHNY